MTAIPLLTDLFNGIITSLQVQFNVTILPYGKSFLRGLAGSWAGQLKKVYLAIGNLQKNMWYDTADPEAQGGTLERYGRTFLQRNPFPATQGTYTVSVSGSAGAVINADVTAVSDDSSLSPGLLYILDNAYILTGTSDTITLRAMTAGTAADLNVGDTLTFSKPIVNVNPGLTVLGVVTSAVDAETTEEYRAEIDLHVILEPQGGAPADYRLWASEFNGVAKVYPYTASGAPWQVNVYIEAILSDSIGPPHYGVPTTTILNGATADILTDPNTGKGRKPMGVLLGPGNVGALAVTVYQVAITFTGSTGISSGDQTIIKNALIEAVRNIRPFIAACDDVADQNDTISVSLPASGGRIAPPEAYVIVVIAMQAVPGALFTGVTMTVNGISQTSYTFDLGIIPFLDPANIHFT